MTNREYRDEWTADSGSFTGIVAEFQEFDGTIRKKLFSLCRSMQDETSLIDLAEVEVELTRRTIVDGARILQREIRLKAQAKGPTEAAVCEASILRDLNPWSLDSFTDLVCLATFLHVIREERPDRIAYLGNDPLIDRCLRDICTAESVEFVSGRRAKPGPKSPSSFLRRSAVLHLLREVTVRGDFSRRRFPSSRRRPTVGLVAPFAHLNRSVTSPNIVTSGYWGRLPEVLVDAGADVVLVHHFSPVLGWWERRMTSRAIMRSSPDTPRITHLSSRPAISVALALASWRRWRAALGSVRQILREMDYFVEGTDLGWLWSFLRQSVEADLTGHSSLINLATRAAMESDLGQFSDIDRWVIATENQAWEHTFVSARRREGHSQFDAFVHVPVRPWDLRMFALAADMAQSDLRGGVTTFDRLLVASPLDVRALVPYLRGPHQLSPVEWIRFRPLSGTAPGVNQPVSRGKLVVLGDYDRLETEAVVKVAERIVSDGCAPDGVEFRPHPLHVARDEDLSERILNACSISLNGSSPVTSVVASSRTSALYAYLEAGCSVVIALATKGLNFCPIASAPGLSFAVDSSGAVSEPVAVREGRTASPAPPGPIFLDENLPRWLAVLRLADETDPPDV